MPDVMYTGLPQDIEAEKAALGLVLFEPENFSRLAAILSADDFAVERHRVIFATLEALYKAGAVIDTVSLVGRLRDAQKLESIGGLAYLSDLYDPLSGAVADFDQVCRRVKDKAVLRKTILECERLKNECLMNGDSREVLEQAERSIRDLSSENQRDRRLKTAGEIVSSYGGMDAFLANTIPVATLPFSKLNFILGGGFREEELILLAARPGVGKSAMADQIAEHNGSQGVGVAKFSLEMSDKESLVRMACSRAGVDSNALRHSNNGRDFLTKEQRIKLNRAMGELAEMPIYYDDTASATVAAIHAAVRRLMAREPMGLVIIDYVQLMDAPGRHSNGNERVSAISRGLKLSAKELKLPFLVLSQVTRESVKAGEKIKLHHLRESGALEQDANTVIALNPNEDDWNQPVRRVLGEVLKQRNGPIGPIDLFFKPAITRFAEATAEAPGYAA